MASSLTDVAKGRRAYYSPVYVAVCAELLEEFQGSAAVRRQDVVVILRGVVVCRERVRHRVEEVVNAVEGASQFLLWHRQTK